MTEAGWPMPGLVPGSTIDVFRSLNGACDCTRKISSLFHSGHVGSLCYYKTCKTIIEIQQAGLEIITHLRITYCRTMKKVSPVCPSNGLQTFFQRIMVLAGVHYSCKQGMTGCQFIGRFMQEVTTLCHLSHASIASNSTRHTTEA